MIESLRLRHIAGYCPEEAIWKMIIDLCESACGQAGVPLLSPESILVDADSFLVDVRQKRCPEFLPPECHGDDSTLTSQQFVWSLGACVYYASSGRTLFGGHGGSYQHSYPHVALPVLQKKHQALTPVVQRCLQSEPSARIGVKELLEIAKKEHTRCRMTQRQHIASHIVAPPPSRHDCTGWPEEMTDIGN